MRKANQQTWLVLLVYVTLTIMMTWPLTAQLGTHLAGNGDMMVHQWTFWWVKQSILSGHSPFYTDLMFYPQGASLAAHNFAWFHIIAWLPLQAIVGNIAAYNLIFIVAFALNGFAMYLLAHEMTGSKPAAFIGGLVGGFWPYALSHYEHPNLIVTCWVPLALVYLRRTLKNGQKRDALLTAFFLFLTGLTRWHLLIMGGIIIGLYLLYKCLTEKACRSRRTVSMLVLVGLVTGILLILPAAPVAIAQLTRTNPEDIFLDEQTTGQTDLLAYVLPSHYNPLWGDAVLPLYEKFKVNQVYVPVLGYTVIALALYGAATNWPQARFWILAAVVYVALAIGPQLRINGQLYPQIPMPYRLVGDAFFIRVLRKPDRFNVFLGLPLGMLASLGIQAMLHRRPFSQRPFLLIGIAGTLILAEYCPIPYTTTLPAIPAWYGQLAQEPGQFGILDLPTHSHTYDKHYMLYQTTHAKPLVVGHVSRPPRETLAFIESVPYLTYARQHNAMDPALTDVSHQLRPLARANVRYIVLHKKLARTKQLAAWQNWLTFDPYYEDADTAVYRTTPQLGHDFDLAHLMTDEIGLIWATLTPTRAIQASLIEAHVRWGSTAAPDQDYDVCLNLVSAGQIAQSRCETLSPTWPTFRWEANEVVRGTHALQIDPFLEAGTYSATLTLADSVTGATAGRPHVLALLPIETQPRTFVEPKPAHSFHVAWGDDVLLRGYDLETFSDVLELTLYWQAQRRMDASYKIFVHLIDTSTGALVVQADTVPRQWTYPTTWWERDEVIRDTISLPMDGAPPGQYHLMIGIYDQGTGERPSAYSAEGEYPDGAITLTTVQR
ncbi:MAG: hypothetical protein GY832_19480 [Chloroflexi bacterium]|nr:hypothetical protein [Chloroflexota bacterium]